MEIYQCSCGTYLSPVSGVGIEPLDPQPYVEFVPHTLGIAPWCRSCRPDLAEDQDEDRAAKVE